MRRKLLVGLFVGLSIVLVGCSESSSNVGQENAEIAVASSAFEKQEIGFAELMRRKRDIYQKYSGLDKYQEAYFSSMILYGDQFDRGAINYDQLLIYENQARSQMETSQNIECIKMRQDQNDSNYSGVNSTSGAVAIISMAALLADSAAVSKACR